MMMMWRVLLLLLALAAGSRTALAQESGPAGRWALRAGDSTLVVLELRPVRGSRGTWQGSMTRPALMQIAAGGMATLTVIDPAPIIRAVRGTTVGEGISLRVTNAKGGEDLWRFVAAGDRAVLTIDEPLPPGEATPPPLRLVRAGDRERLSADLAAESRYVLSARLPNNAEMKAIFEADQADRRDGANIDWAAVTPRDTARRERTKQLLDAGALQSGDDFWHAAFVFQHGGESSSYLLAHTLALVATARGRPDATWIAAATLDRYLQSVGQPQVYGTQYGRRDGAGWNQDPYDRALVSDALRAALGVPALAQQAERLREMEAQHKAPEPARK